MPVTYHRRRRRRASTVVKFQYHCICSVCQRHFACKITMFDVNHMCRNSSRALFDEYSILAYTTAPQYATEPVLKLANVITRKKARHAETYCRGFNTGTITEKSRGKQSSVLYHCRYSRQTFGWPKLSKQIMPSLHICPKLANSLQVLFVHIRRQSKRFPLVQPFNTKRQLVKRKQRTPTYVRKMRICLKMTFRPPYGGLVYNKCALLKAAIVNKACLQKPECHF